MLSVVAVSVAGHETIIPADKYGNIAILRSIARRCDRGMLLQRETRYDVDNTHPRARQERLRHEPSVECPSGHFVVGYFGELGQMALQSDFERTIPRVSGSRAAQRCLSFHKDMMAAVHTDASPAASLDEASEVAAGQRLHMAISRIAAHLRPRAPRHQPTGSLLWPHAGCARVRPSSRLALHSPEWPGLRPGNHPLSASCTTTLIFMSVFPKIE